MGISYCMVGPLYHNGMYHLFFEYNPHGALFGTCTLSWGHSVSGDLVNWTFLGTALDPTLPFDANGCWSGSATVMPDGRPAIVYTGRGADNVEVQNVAFPKNPSDPLLREWSKPSWNPMIPQPADVGNPSLEPGPYQKNFRDPSTAWRGHDGCWRLAVAAEIGGVGSILIYRSADFVHWQRNAAPFYATPAVSVWECPDLFPVMEHGTEGLDTSANGPGVRHVFKLTQDKDEDYYVVGRYDDEADTFTPVEEGVTGHVGDNYNWRRIDHGHVFAARTFFDARKKRRVLWVWADEMDSRSDNIAKGWAGIMVLPRKLWLDTDGKQLVQWPVEEFETLRRKRVALLGAEIGSGGLHEIAGIDTLQADVEVVFEIPNLEDAERLDPKWLKNPRACAEAAATQGGVGPFGLVVMASGDMREQTTVFFRVYEHHGTYKVIMCVDLRRSSTREGVKKPFYAGFVDVDVKKDRSISLRTLIDHSVIESFGGGGRACFTARVYPEHIATGASTHLYVFNNGSDAVTVSKLEAWELATASVNVEDDGLIGLQSPNSPLVYAKNINWNKISNLIWDKDERAKIDICNLNEEIKNQINDASRKDAKSLMKTYTRNTSLVAILIATITFAAAFTLSGGYSSSAGSEGLPIMARKIAFQAFIIFDTLGMFSSLAVAFICVIARWMDFEFLLRYRFFTKYLMWFAYMATTLAFASGLYTALAPRLHWLAIAICVISVLLPILTMVIGEWHLSSSIGWRSLLKRRYRKPLNANLLGMV